MTIFVYYKKAMAFCVSKMNILFGTLLLKIKENSYLKIWIKFAYIMQGLIYQLHIL